LPLREPRGGDAAAPEERSPISTPVLIPEGHVADLGVHLGPYRRIAALQDEKEGFAGAAGLLRALVEIAYATKPDTDRGLPQPTPPLIEPRLTRRA
jgi:hypothetical protein